MKIQRLAEFIRQPKSFIVVVCLLAFVIRLSAMFLGSTYHVVEDDTHHFGFGWEMGRVAYSLVDGNGFASPLPLATGPTAIVGPVYPILLAGIFKVFGTYTTASAIAIRVLQSVFSSLICLFIYLCARDTVGSGTGRIAAFIWSVFPLNIFFTVMKVWETSLTSLLAVMLFWCLLSVYSSKSLLRWSGIGVLLGVAALTSASLLVFIVPFGVMALWKNRMRAVLPAVAGALTSLLVVAPWMVRNDLIFGKIMLRSNFPLEFRVGNNLQSYGQKIEGLHPSNNAVVNEHWRIIGETRFMGEERRANSEFLAMHVDRFAFSTINRVVNFWTSGWIRTIDGFPNSWPLIAATSLLSLLGLLGVGQMFGDRKPAVFAYAGCMFLFPIAYYITTSQPRFYHAITPLLIIAGTYFVYVSWGKLTSNGTSQ